MSRNGGIFKMPIILHVGWLVRGLDCPKLSAQFQIDCKDAVLIQHGGLKLKASWISAMSLSRVLQCKHLICPDIGSP